MKIRSTNIIKCLLFTSFILTNLSAFSAKKTTTTITGGIIGCEVEMSQELVGTPIIDTILRLRNFNSNTIIKVTRIVSFTASGRSVYDTAAGTRFPRNFNGTLTPNSGVLIPFSMLTNSRIDPGLNVAQVLFYWVPSDPNATVGLKIAAVKSINNYSGNSTQSNHCHVVANQEVAVESKIPSESVPDTAPEPVPGPAPEKEPVTEHAPGPAPEQEQDEPVSGSGPIPTPTPDIQK